MKTLEARREELEVARREILKACQSNGSGVFKFCDRLTDTGAAERFAVLKGGEVRYCDHFKRWLVWDGTRWKLDDSNAITLLAKEVNRHLYYEAAKETIDDRRKGLIEYVMKSESAARVKAMLELLKGEVPITPDRLDRDPWLLNVENGAINLKIAELELQDPAQFITKKAPVRFSLKAYCPTWDAFLERIMDGDRAKIDYLQKAVGYSLTGDTREQALFIAYGLGANGKSTFTNAINRLLGDYALQAPIETFLQRRNESIPNDVARLMGARFVSAIEADQGRRLAEGLIKQLTGGDTVTARFLYGEFFQFRPTFKLWLATNHRPIVRGNDLAIWRRIRLIPFTVTIPPEEQDRELPEKLEAELPGILNWALAGCLAWQREGLGDPEAVRVATESYRDEMDLLSDFLTERCEVDSVHVVSKADLYRAYSEWCRVTGLRDMSQRSLSFMMTERGFESDRIHGGTRIWRGICLKEPERVTGDAT